MIYHIVNYYEAKNEDELRRNAFATSSWQPLYKWGAVPVYVKDADVTRSSKDLGDTRPVPYVKDIINAAIFHIETVMDVRVSGSDIFLFTNMDTILHKNILKVIEKQQLFYGCRRELEEDTDKLLGAREISKLRLAHESSADVFVFTLAWWLANRNSYPDLLLGCQWWDTTMIDLMEATKAKGENIRVTKYIYHRNHKPFWFSEDNMFKNVGQKHNRELSQKWDNPNKNTKFADVRAWEKRLENKMNSALGTHHVKVGNTTYVF